MVVWQGNNFGAMHDLILKGIDFDFSVLKYTSKKILKNIQRAWWGLSLTEEKCTIFMLEDVCCL